MPHFDKWSAALPYREFLAKYGTASQQARWQQTLDAVSLKPGQRELLAAFGREMKVLCLAGTWCGDCSGQCPIFERFAEAAPVVHVRYLDRDEHADVQRELQINGGNRVPVLVFFSEDGFEVARCGERTLSKYRAMMHTVAGANWPTGIIAQGDSLMDQVVQDWLNEFERVQWILRLSPRLRQQHGD
ncbi:MAG TPA: thioredoxin family protein [Gemmataceae bacterium]|jgi:thiol-disulfide isomerase/thioredoxin|nr:thioredoxin family protein [Gemmataceae bacterium]